MLEKLLEIIADVFMLSDDQVEGISYDTHFVIDLDADSLDLAEIAVSVEDVFDIKVDEEESDCWKTVRDVIKTIENHI